MLAGSLSTAPAANRLWVNHPSGVLSAAVLWLLSAFSAASRRAPLAGRPLPGAPKGENPRTIGAGVLGMNA